MAMLLSVGRDKPAYDFDCLYTSLLYVKRVFSVKEQLKKQRLNECTYPVDKMRLDEVWEECRLRLKIESKEELFDALKSIEQRLSSVLRLSEETSRINLARLKMVLKALRKENVMLANEDSDAEDMSESQHPA